MWPFKKKVTSQPPDPEIRFITAFTCKNKHLQDEKRWVNISTLLGESQICNQCGESATPAIFRTEDHWKDDWSLEYYLVRKLEDPMKLTDDAFTKIKSYAAKKFVGTPTPEQQDVYQQGLKDGTTAFSRWILEQITGEEQDA